MNTPRTNRNTVKPNAAKRLVPWALVVAMLTITVPAPTQAAMIVPIEVQVEVDLCKSVPAACDLLPQVGPCDGPEEEILCAALACARGDPCLQADPGIHEVEAFEVIRAPVCTGTGAKVNVEATGSAWGVNLLVWWYVSGNASVTSDVQWSVQCNTEVEYYAIANGGAYRFVTATIDTAAGHDGTACSYQTEGWCKTPSKLMPVGTTYFNGTTESGGLLPQNIYACAKTTTVVTAESRNLYVPLDKVTDTIDAVCGLSSAIVWPSGLTATDAVEELLPII